MKDNLKNVFNFFLRVGLSAGLLFWLFKKIDFSETEEVFKAADVTYIIYAAIIFLGINAIMLVRWLILIRALKLKAKTFSVVRYFFIGLFGNLFLPSAVGGDIIKILGLCRDCVDQKPRVVASVLLDRLSGFCGIVTVATVSFFFGRDVLGNSLIIPILIMAIVSSLFLLISFNKTAFRSFNHIFSFLPKFKKSMAALHEDIALLKDKKSIFFLCIGLSAFSQIVFAICYFLLAKSLHQDVELLYFVIFVPIICVATSLPSIGGLGVREAGAAYLFGKVGMQSGVAVGISLINFIFMVIIGLVGGLIYVLTLRAGRLQHHPPASKFKSTEV